MVGELDILKTPAYARAIAGGIPGAEFVIIPGAGHAVSWEKPGAFNSSVLGFVMKHAAHPEILV
jgi:pimeloyl-ACP methyl ester carboxylesterase